MIALLAGIAWALLMIYVAFRFELWFGVRPEVTKELRDMLVADILKGRGLTLALAESCTGGLVAARLTAVPGASHVLERGYVTYSNVNAVEEMVNMISASRSYQNNVEVLNTARTLLAKTLNLGT